MALTPKRPISHQEPGGEPQKAARAVARLSVDVPEPVLRGLKIRAAVGRTTIQRIVLRLLLHELSESPSGRPEQDSP